MNSAAKIKAFKLFSLRQDGSLGSLFINRKLRVPIGKWLKAKKVRTKGYAFRPGFHACTRPIAPHLSMKGRIWCEVELREVVEFTRPKCQGESWLIAKHMKVVRILDSNENTSTI